MKKIFSLTKVFVKEFYQNLNIFDKRGKKFNKKSLFFWLSVILILSLSYISYKAITFLGKFGQMEIFLNFYFGILTVLLLFQAILVCSNVFFFSKDTEKVLHMPIKSTELLFSKFNTLLCMLYFSEAIFGVVPLTLFGLLNHVNFVFYFWEIFILALLPIFISAIVSVFLLIFMRFSKFVKNKNLFQYLVTFALIIFVCVLEFALINIAFNIQNENQVLGQINSISSRLEEAGKYFLVINPSIKILLNPTEISSCFELIKLILLDFILVCIFYIIGKKTYLKDLLKIQVTNTANKEKVIDISKKIKPQSKAKSYIKKEIKTLTREPVFFMQCIIPVVLVLIFLIVIIIVLMPNVTNIMQDESIKELVSKLSFNQEAICDILIIMQVLFSFSTISLTAISREGKNAEIVKNIPVELYKQFVFKNIPQIILNAIVSLVVLGIVWRIIPNVNFIYLITMFIISIFINIINSYVMLIIDLRRPNLNWDTEYSVIKKTDNKVYQYAFMIINVLFLMYLAKIFKSTEVWIYLLSQLAIYILIFIVMDRCIKKWQKKLFNKIM